MTDINFAVQYAVDRAFELHNDKFQQPDEMDKMLGLASDDPLKTTLKEILPKYARDFYTSIEQKGSNTKTEASLKKFTTLYCSSLIQNIFDNYKDESKEKLEKMCDYVHPFAVRIIAASEAESIPKPSSMLEDMLSKCVTRFAVEYKNK